MTKKRKNKVGAISQDYMLHLQYERFGIENGMKTKTKVEKEASLTIEPYRHHSAFTMDNLLNFQKNANLLLKEIRKLLRAGTFLEVELIVSAYEDVEEHLEPTSFGPIRSCNHQIAFDRWVYSGNGHDGEGALELEDKENGGLYLLPDTKYTEEHRDIFIPWTEDILQGLAEANL